MPGPSESLAVLESGESHQFDLDQPMHTPVMVASHAARVDGDPAPPLRADGHADQLRLMPQPGHGSASGDRKDSDHDA